MNFKHNFKKQFGQNFLKSTRFPKLVADYLDLKEGETVVEIGPGDGILTNQLLERNVNVICIELDYDLIPKLIGRFKNNPLFHIVHEDILKIDASQILEKYASGATNIKIAGSLPYNISKQIIDKFIKLHFSDSNVKIDKMCFIVQDEVAKEYVSLQPKATFLSNYLKLFAKVKKLESIPASQFVPKPKVDGGILLIEPKNSEDLEKNVYEIQKIVRIGFSSPRKKLKSNLKNSNKFESESIDDAFKNTEINEDSRPAELDNEQWVALSKFLKPQSN